MLMMVKATLTGITWLHASLHSTQGGGFCGSRTLPLPRSDWSGFDGVALRVKGDGQIFKLNVKTVSCTATG